MNLSLEEFDLIVPMLLQKYKFLIHLFSFFSSHFHYFYCISGNIESAVYCSISCNFYTLVTPDIRGWEIPFVSVGGRNHSFGREEKRRERQWKKKKYLEQNSPGKTLVQFLKNKTAFMGSLSNEAFG